MSHVALQRVVVRMLHDEVFARAVYDDPLAATGDVELEDHERRWLVAPDPRAYGVDPLRRSRALTGLLEEYAVSCAAIVRALGRTRASTVLDAFFSSSTFHACVQNGDSLAGEFGTWLGGTEPVRTSAPLSAIVALERAIVRARRAREHARSRPATSRAPDDSWLVLAPGVVVHTTAEGAAARYGAVLAALRSHAEGLVRAVLDELRPLPLLDFGRGEAGVIVDARTEHVRLEGTSVELARVLAPCAEPVEFDEFVARAAEVGATREDCGAIATSFLEDGILHVVAEP